MTKRVYLLYPSRIVEPSLVHLCDPQSVSVGAKTRSPSRERGDGRASPSTWRDIRTGTGMCWGLRNSNLSDVCGRCFPERRYNPHLLLREGGFCAPACIRDVRGTKRERGHCPCVRTWWIRLRRGFALVWSWSSDGAAKNHHENGSRISSGVLGSAEDRPGLPAAPSSMDSTSICWIPFMCQIPSGHWWHTVNKTKSLSLFYFSQIDSSAVCVTSLSLRGCLSSASPYWLSPGHKPSKVRSYKPIHFCWPHQWWPSTVLYTSSPAKLPMYLT